MYELIQNIIRILPMLAVAALFIYLVPAKWYVRSVSVVLAGWGILILFVHLYWWYSFEFAPTPEAKNEISFNDTGPGSAVYVLGWVYGLAFYIVLEAASLLIKAMRHIFKRA